MEFLEVPLFDDDIYKLLVRFALNLFFLSFIVAFAIYPSQREREFAFTAVMMNVVVFFICFALKKLDLGIGMALGLFAIFGVLRYRTDAIPAKEMTYLFIVIGMAVINSLSNKKTSYAEVALVNSLIIASAMLKECIVGAATARANGRKQAEKLKAASEAAAKPRKAQKYSIEYDRLDMLGVEQRTALLEDIRARTNLDVIDVQIRNIDLPQGRATLQIRCSDGPSPPPDVAADEPEA